ncbi:MAG TPA: hemolysin family protein [Thermomicrobiales bacterium]|nr:hemolysin family protein [Thermomicrobiales bacterium]
MDSGDWQHLVIAALALLVVVGAGIVLTVVGQTTNQRLVPDTGEHVRGHRSTRSMVNPRRAIASAMLFLQIITAVIASGQVTHLIDRSTEQDFSWLAILLVAVIYIIFGLALPRAIAGKQLDRLFDVALACGRGATRLLAPVDWFVERAAGLFRRLIPAPDALPDTIGLEEELRHRRFMPDDGVIGVNEREMIDGILSLEEMTVRDIMVPRLDIVALDRFVRPKELIDTITKAGHSRIPVYQESIDRILGVLYVKDLLPFVIGNTIRIPLLDLIRPAFVVPESKKLTELFTELKRTKIHMAIVADEYGGTAGLVTIEDILEEIVGEIQDEYDTETPLFKLAEDGALIADGRLPIEDVEDALHVTFEEDDDFGTLGGFVHKHLGRLPIQGDTFEAEGVRVQILAVERHRVRELRITKLERPEEDAPEEPRDRWRRREESSDESDTAEGVG